MRLIYVTITTLLFLFQSSVAQALPTAEQAGNAAIGGALGGLLGNQVGNGRGKTIATVAGAATGVVIASGCKLSAGTAIGGLLGGLLGSQVGGGNGSNIMAGVGAGVGALLGSDCQPGAEPVAVAPLPNVPPFTINGLKLTPVNGFPQEAFYGIPPIVTPDDALAAAKMVRLLSDVSYKARTDNPELSILSMYWAKRISATTLGILSASLQAIQTNTGTSASIPAKGLVILPAFNEFRPAGKQALFNAMENMLAADKYTNSKGVMVADNGGFGSALDFLSKAVAPPAQQQPAAQQSFNSPVHKGLIGLPLNVVLRLPDGTQVMRTSDALTIFNPNDLPIKLPLDKLDFMPRTPSPSFARQAASDLMFSISRTQTEWSYNYYQQKLNGRNFETHIAAPNKIVDVANGNVVVAYLNDYGSIADNSGDGERAYRTNVSYKRAVDTLGAIEIAPPVLEHTNSCKVVKGGHYYTLDGMYANLMQAICFQGQYSDRSRMYVRSFYIGEGAEVVQTLDSLNTDKKNQAEMTKALTGGGAISDSLSFVQGYNNIESGLRCAGNYTMAQYGAVWAANLDAGVPRSGLLSNWDVAKIAGWTPPPSDEWNFDRVVNCVSAIPLVGNVASATRGAGKVATRVGVDVLSDLSAARLDTLKSLTNAFNSPSSTRAYVKSFENVNNIIPGNAGAATFLKAMYDVAMTQQNMSQTKDGMSALYATYLK